MKKLVLLIAIVTMGLSAARAQEEAAIIVPVMEKQSLIHATTAKLQASLVAIEQAQQQLNRMEKLANVAEFIQQVRRMIEIGEAISCLSTDIALYFEYVDFLNQHHYCRIDHEWNFAINVVDHALDILYMLIVDATKYKPGEKWKVLKDISDQLITASLQISDLTINLNRLVKTQTSKEALMAIRANNSYVVSKFEMN